MSRDPDISRRQLLRGKFLAGLAGGISDALAPVGDGPPPSGGAPTSDAPGCGAAPGAANARHGRAFPVHRPPGAIDEAAFLAGCTRCDACLDACPHDAIVHAPARMRGAVGTPIIDVTRQPCMMCDDTPCIPACEPGVLSFDVPLTMGRAMIVEQTCLAYQGTFCTVCSEQCPVEGAITLDVGKPTIVEDRCTGCGVCHYVCPAPSNAVIVIPLADRPPRPVADSDAGAGAVDGDDGDDPDRIVFPQMNNAVLDAAQVGQLFEDLETHAAVLEVRMKGERRSFVDDVVTLTDARAAVETRSVRGVQIRYTYEDALWTDTLMIVPDGVRLVRVRHQSA